MTPLRGKMQADLRLRNLSAGTSQQYIHHVARFARHFHRSPALLGTDEVREWLLHEEARGLSASTRIVQHAALKFLYDQTLGRPEVMATVPRPRRGTQARGVPLVREEVVALLARRTTCGGPTPPGLSKRRWISGSSRSCWATRAPRRRPATRPSGPS